MYTNNYTSICICICVIIPYNIVDYSQKTIGDMQNEKYFYGHYKMFVYNHDSVILLKYKYIYINMYIKYNYNM